MAAHELLARVALFSEREAEELARISDAAMNRGLRRGDVLFSEGAEPDELFVVVSGRIAVANKSTDGRESVVALMEAGDVFGEMPLFDGLGRSTEARALEPSEVVAIPYAPVQEVYESRPMLLWSVVAMLSGRIRAMNGELADSVFLDVTGRTATRRQASAASSARCAGRDASCTKPCSAPSYRTTVAPAASRSSTSGTGV